MKKSVFLAMLLVFCLLCGCGKTTSATTTAKPAEKEEVPPAKTEEVQPSEEAVVTTAFADIAIQDYGTITVELDGTVAPKTVANFVKLAESGFYDGLTFHRIIAGFMIQGGDPLGNGTGGSDERIVGEFAANGIENNLKHTRGVISMARAQDPNSASSQFFIMHQDAPHLDGMYAAFGCVTEGIEIVDAICEDAQPVDGNGTIPAEAQPVIETVTIRY
jgi:peptidyl-prolyl cis-trans isomerase B (cyclophilin B)